MMAKDKATKDMKGALQFVAKLGTKVVAHRLCANIPFLSGLT